MEHTDSRIQIRKPIENLGALIRTAVVDADQLPILKRLVHDTADSRHQVLARIVNGDDDGHCWLIHDIVSPPLCCKRNGTHQSTHAQPNGFFLGQQSCLRCMEVGLPAVLVETVDH